MYLVKTVTVFKRRTASGVTHDRRQTLDLNELGGVAKVMPLYAAYELLWGPLDKPGTTSVLMLV
jgi:NADH:ubiquinone oxidoreductase subunit 4 (subunit M)